MDNLVARALNILYTTTGSLDKCRIILHKYYTDMLNSLCTDVTQIFHDDTEIMQETKSEDKNIMQIFIGYLLASSKHLPTDSRLNTPSRVFRIACHASPGRTRSRDALYQP